MIGKVTAAAFQDLSEGTGTDQFNQDRDEVFIIVNCGNKSLTKLATGNWNVTFVLFVLQFTYSTILNNLV